jgi:hypothetical protein
MCNDALVEILHTILLGVVKYWWRHTVDKIKSSPKKKQMLSRLLSGLSADGLGFTKLNGTNMVKRSGSLYGTDFRKIAQLMPFVVKHFSDEDELCAWQAVSHMSALAFRTSITDLPTYLVRGTFIFCR